MFGASALRLVSTFVKPVKLPPNVAPDLVVTADDLKGDFFLWDIAHKHLSAKKTPNLSLEVAKLVSQMKMDCPELCTKEREFGHKGVVGDQIKFPSIKSWGIDKTKGKTRGGDEFVDAAEAQKAAKEKEAWLRRSLKTAIPSIKEANGKVTPRQADLIAGYINQAKEVGPDFMKEEVAALTALAANVEVPKEEETPKKG